MYFVEKTGVSGARCCLGGATVAVHLHNIPHFTSNVNRADERKKERRKKRRILNAARII